MARPWLLLLLLLLAGCTSDEPAPKESPDQVDQSLGRISGATVTPDIRPIGGVTVTMQPGNFETRSNLFGGFRFDTVSPGSYEITATHPDYEPVTERVNIVAGQTIKPRLVLEEDLPPVPSFETETFNGYVPASLGPAENQTSGTQGQLGVGNCTCVFFITPQPMMQTVVLDATWTDSVEPAQATAFRWRITIDDERVLTGSGAKPLNAHIHDVQADWGNASKIQIELVPDEVWPAYEQSYELYVTTFLVAPAPDGWTYFQE